MFVIGITGGTASGKTTFVNSLKTIFNKDNLTILSQDNYYKSLKHLTIKEREKNNFDHPDSIDFSLLNEHLSLLKHNKTIEVPNYCFNTHDRLAKTTTIVPKKVIIIEGILILSQPEIKKACDYTIFIDANAKIRMQRRLKRDVEERSRTTECVLMQFKTHITPMHNTFVEPVKTNVDLVINGTKSFQSNLDKISVLINKHL